MAVSLAVYAWIDFGFFAKKPERVTEHLSFTVLGEWGVPFPGFTHSL